MLSIFYSLKKFGYIHGVQKAKRNFVGLIFCFMFKGVGKLFIKILILKYFSLSLFFRCSINNYVDWMYVLIFFLF